MARTRLLDPPSSHADAQDESNSIAVLTASRSVRVSDSADCQSFAKSKQPNNEAMTVPGNAFPAKLWRSDEQDADTRRLQR